MSANSSENMRKPRRRATTARIEPLESRIVLDATFTQMFGLNNATNTVVYGPNLNSNNVSYIHTFHITFLKDAGTANLTYNTAQLHNDNLVHIPISGTVTGPQPTGFHGAELDIIVNGNTANPAGVITSFTDLGTSQPGANGNDTIFFMQGILLPAGETVNSIGLVFKNQSVGEMTPLIPLTSLTIDTIAPSIKSIGPIPSSNPTSVDTIPVTLTDAITPSSFTLNALSLTRDGANVPLSSSATIAPTDGTNTKFLISGLSGFTNVSGNYKLTINAANLVDPALNSGAGLVSASFGVGTAARAIPTVTAPVTPRNSPVSSLTVDFSAPVDATSFGLSALSLLRNNVNVPLTNAVTISPSSGNATSFTISGLGGFTSTDGSYVFSVDGTKVSDSAHTPGTGTSDVGFVIDTVAPTIIGDKLTFAAPGGALNAVTVNLSKDINPTSFTPALLTLTRAGVPIDLSHLTITSNNGSRSSFIVSGLGPSTTESGSYILSIDPSGLRDDAGNSGTGAPLAIPFTVNGPKVTVVGPIATPRLAPLDPVAITFSGPIDASTFNGSNILLSRDGVPVPLTGLTTSPSSGDVSSITVSGLAPFTSTPGVYVLSAIVGNSTDPFGSPLAAGGYATFVVKGQPSVLASVTPTTDFPQFPNPNPYFPLNSAIVTFTAPINPGSFSLDSIHLTNGSTNVPIISTVTITRISATQYQIGNLASVAGRAGLYTLTITPGTIVDLYNQSVQGTVSTTYNHIVSAKNGGPAVKRVQRTANPHQPTNIVITFNHALDQTSALNLANYALFTKPARGIGQPVVIGYASYKAATNQVTLYTSFPIPIKTKLQLFVYGTVSTGVTDTLGRPLTGSVLNPNGGGTYATVFGGASSVIGPKK